MTKLPTLYQLTDEYLAAFTKLQELELDEQTVSDTLEGLRYPIEQKGMAVAQMARNMEALAAQIKEAECAMAARRKSLDQRAARLRAYLKDNMERVGISKIDSPYFHIALRKNPPSLDITDPDAIPDRYMRIPPVPAPEPDKPAIKAALERGEEIAGCAMRQSTRLEIK